MTDFKEGTQLKKPDELTQKRYINPDTQLCKDDACKLAKDNGVVWGVD